MKKKVAILGAGNAGCTFAAHLSFSGHEVRLYEPVEFKKNIEAILEKKEIEITGTIQGVGKISLITTDIAEAIDSVDIIIVPVPAYAQEAMMKAMLPHLKEGSIILFLPGNYASLRFNHLLKDAGLENKVILAETSSMVYACRRTGDTQVNLRGIKKNMPIAAMPANRTDLVLGIVNELFNDVFHAADNVLQISMENPNCVVHCPTCILNAGWIQTTKGNFDFYWEGMSEAVCEIMLRIDNERLLVGKQLGFTLTSAKDTLYEFYGIKGDSYHEMLTTSLVHGKLGAPSSLKDRYVSEDVPFGLTPIAELGRLVGVETPFVNSIILLASAMNNTDYLADGVDLKTLGFENCTPQQAMSFVRTGVL